MKSQGRSLAATALLAAVAALSLTGVTVTEAMAQSQAWQQIKNNNHVIDRQKSGGGSPGDAGEVTIDFFGHAAFRVTSPSGLTILFDPWRNDPSGAWGLWFPNPFPQVEVDTVMSTHAHFDHDAIERPQAQMILDRMTGVYEFGDARVTGLADKHQCEAPGWYAWTNAMPEFGQPQCPPDNYHHLDNNIYVIETGGLRIAIWGDNRQNPADHIWPQLNDLDVLILPVDASQHILSYKQATDIVERLSPRIVIPEHYLTKGASITLTTLGTAEEWTKSNGSHTVLDGPTLKLTPDEAKKYSKHVMYFAEHHLKE
jgi:L-ascorbate metabolism protein UlaG (beta-lactamase superfamily)